MERDKVLCVENSINLKKGKEMNNNFQHHFASR